jgi:hypothetical protein
MMTRKIPARWLRGFGLGAVVLLTATAHAGGSKSLKYTSYKQFDDGETKGVLISSLGELKTGFATRKVAISVPFVRAAATAPDGTVYLGTGDEGELHAFARGQLRKVAKIDSPVISAVAVGPDGKVYCGTVADGRVVAVDPRTGAWKQLAQLGKKGETHVWALVWDARRKLLYAGTGPRGGLYAIDTKGHARVLWEADEKQLLALRLANDGSGALYVGAGEKAVLYRVEADGRARVLHAFAADEVHSLMERHGSVYVAVNEFQGGAAPPPTAVVPTRIVSGGRPGPAPAKPPLPRMGTRAGKGAVYRWDPDGRIEQLHSLPDSYLTEVYVEPNGDVYAAAGGHGRVYLIKPDQTVYTAYEFPERQVLTMALGGPTRLFGTGDAGALYVLEPGTPKGAQFTSKVFDAGFLARFGRLRWHGTGKVQFETRTGNTAKPDKTWSGWQKVDQASVAGELGTAKIRGSEVRFFQFRTIFGAEHAVLRDVTIYYLPQNQRPHLTEVVIGDAPSVGPPVPGIPRPAGLSRPSPSTKVKIHWKAENPDGDELTYRLFIREESDPVWKPLGGTEPLTKTDFDWETEAIPDGHYVAKVVVSDERSNPKDRVLTHELVSMPYLVDNRKPEVQGLNVRYPFLSGRARDSYSVLTELAYCIDGGDWVLFYPSDGIFDDTAKSFAIRLPDDLKAGQHTVTVHTTDETGNQGSERVTFRVSR